MTGRSRRGVIIAVVVVVVLAVGGYFAGRALWHSAKSALAYDHCTVGDYELDPDQASVAATMVGAVTSYRPVLPERAAVLVLAAGLQESKLRNLAPGEGDRDSVGVLQQRPSQDWGKVDGKPNSTTDREKRLNDVFFATTTFLDHLIKVDGWQQMTLADAVQAVQISADGGAYAQHEGEATALANALQGKVAAGITCEFEKPTKVATTGQVVKLVTRDLPVNAPAAAGLQVRVPGAGWQTAAWFVANADRLGIDQVAYKQRQWSRTNGWHAASASADAVVATMYRL
ncbi:hypothetical protein M6B22_16240 [Jatrophihabitans cynanchi]|uniref:ARB-07466-like C-terminal domain-containing protein n=1 Tax=Jatrophihabitans cynanchi TaxID=2944128 RepID=A0ABY7JYV9_9ACTN|nr:hypothetical protein [Jatrophihabitans sp. SB3-54]WAX56076.1 hypothetical protein M6B22_16240 [Jatrophihabitans sp. SB3-54]